MPEPWELYAQPAAPDQQKQEPWDLYAAKPAPGPLSDPTSTMSTLGRIGTGALAGVADLAGGAINTVAGLAERAGIAKPAEPQTIEYAPGKTQTWTGRIPSVAAEIRKPLGIPELPEDASPVRRGVEAGLTGLATGGRSLISGITSAPTAAQAALSVGKAASGAGAAVVGGELGAKLGEATIGGPEGRFIGSAIGGAAPGAVPRLGTALTERYYGTQARPDAPAIAAAAERQGVTPTAGMLGNEKIQNAERSLAGRGTGFLPQPVVNAREQALVQMRERADQVAAGRGAQHPEPTPGTIGEHVLDTAEQTATNLRGQSSAAQQGMFDQVGHNAPVNIAPVYAGLKAEIAKTDSITARPMVARLQSLEAMMPRDQQGNVVVSQGGQINAPYGVFKDWRSGLGRNTQTLEGVPAGHLDQIYGSATDAMREAAVSQGVHPAQFDATQGITRSLTGSGGPVRALEKIAGTEGTAGRVGALPPERAFNRVVDEQNPAGLQLLERHADPAAVGRIAGDTLRLRAQETLGEGGRGGSGAPIEGIRGGGAAGPRKFANWWENMSPEAKRILGGNQGPAMEDLSTAAGAFNYPTRQTGLTRAVEGAQGGLASRFFTAEALGSATQALGLGRTPGYAAGLYGLMPLLHYLQGRVLESDAARRGMSGAPRTPIATAPNMAELLAQLTAAGTATR